MGTGRLEAIIASFGLMHIDVCARLDDYLISEINLRKSGMQLVHVKHTNRTRELIVRHRWTGDHYLQGVSNTHPLIVPSRSVGHIRSMHMHYNYQSDALQSIDSTQNE